MPNKEYIRKDIYIIPLLSHMSIVFIHFLSTLFNQSNIHILYNGLITLRRCNMSVKDRLLMFGVRPEKADEILRTENCEKLDKRLRHDPICQVVRDMLKDGWIND